MKKDKEFTLYWRTGEREVVLGRTVSEAMMSAGYGGGAIAALDFHASGNDNRYKWNATTREWDVVEKPTHEQYATVTCEDDDESDESKPPF